MFISRLPSSAVVLLVGVWSLNSINPGLRSVLGVKSSVFNLWSGQLYTIILLSILYSNKDKAAWLFNIFKRTK